MGSVLLLGANSDIAIGIARKFAQKGYNIILASRNQEALIPLKDDLQIRYKIEAKAVMFDALDFDSQKFFYQQLNITPDITVTRKKPLQIGTNLKKSFIQIIQVLFQF